VLCSAYSCNSPWLQNSEVMYMGGPSVPGFAPNWPSIMRYFAQHGFIYGKYVWTLFQLRFSSLFPVPPTFERRAPLKRFVSLQLDGRSARHKAATCTNTEYTQTDIHALNGIRTHNPSVGANEDSSCLRPSVHCYRLHLRPADRNV
jgi:hypothetical protein